MRLTLDALLVLDTIDRKGSFAAAAQELHRVPSAITYTVQKLEQDLDVLIFDRRAHRAKLTEAGHELLREGRNILRAANELEACAQRVATGWETELRIAVGEMVPLSRLFPLLEDFYAAHPSGTQIRLSSEVYGGSWDALVSGRADLIVAAPGDAPTRGNYRTEFLGQVEFVFAVAPQHPLATALEPLTQQAILCHRAIAVADSSQHLAPRTAGLLSGQAVLTVPDMPSKIAAHQQGLGVGYLPKHLIQTALVQGTLVAKTLEKSRASVDFFLAWRSGQQGKAFAWFLERLKTLELF